MDALDGPTLVNALDRLPTGTSALALVRASRKDAHEVAASAEPGEVCLPVEAPWIDRAIVEHIPELRRLRIESVQLRAESLEPLAERLSEAEALTVRNCELTDDRLALLGEHLSSTRLQRLDFSENEVGVAGLEAMLENRPELTHLALTATGMWNHELAALNAIDLPRLVSLHLNRNSLSGRHLDGTVAAFPELRTLDLRDNRIRRRSVRSIRAITPPGMEVLLEHNRGSWTWQHRSSELAGLAVAMGTAFLMQGVAPWYVVIGVGLALGGVMSQVDVRVRNRESELAHRERAALPARESIEGEQ